MTFQSAARKIEKLPAGDHRSELQKLLTLLERAVDLADLGDVIGVEWEVHSIAEVAKKYPSTPTMSQTAELCASDVLYVANHIKTTK